MIQSRTDGAETKYVLLPVARGGRRAAASVWLAGGIAFVLLISAGIAYRVAASSLKRMRDNPVSLPVPLSTIPTQIGSWTGTDQTLDATTDEYMRANFADDYVNRRYVNASAGGIWANVYVVYCATFPVGLGGHNPDVCFPANGWIRSRPKTVSEISALSGRAVPCLSHEFHKRAPAYSQVYVLSFYVLNGEITLQESDFSGIFDRTPNISGNPARYVAQVEISSTSEQSVRLAARDLVDTILTFLPLYPPKRVRRPRPRPSHHPPHRAPGASAGS